MNIHAYKNSEQQSMSFFSRTVAKAMLLSKKTRILPLSEFVYAEVMQSPPVGEQV